MSRVTTKPTNTTKSGEPLLELRGINKEYKNGAEVLKVLKDVSLKIHAGEFVAIMGQSGSGKSTLMNIIGCLDWATSGDYLIRGAFVRGLDADGLAKLRRETFGFIFQRYNLLATATAAENVEIPAIYAGQAKGERMSRARALLAKLGLGDRTEHRPGQMSGGQQQRVAIARALVNNPPVILADEPTGALDSKNGEEVLNLLKSLHAEGRTVILITHDAKIAAHARRQVVIHDGVIVSDESKGDDVVENRNITAVGGDTPPLPEVGEAAKMALRALRVNLFRTTLTLLGIIIGVASVVTMMAVGAGSKQSVVDQISTMGTNLLFIRPGAAGIRGTGDIVTLIPADADAIKNIPNVELAAGDRSSRFTLRYGNTDYQSTVTGVDFRYPALRDWQVANGTFFNARDQQSYAPVAVLGQTVVDSLFKGQNPVGEYILIGNVPFEVIGTLVPKGASGMGDQDDVVMVPLTTGLVRLFGGAYVNDITVKVTDLDTIDDTQEAIRQMLVVRHRTEDFNIRNMSSLLDTVTATQNTLTILLGTVAAISLLVGGIGVMNIMLVSVTERTREIGVRMATGARQQDVMIQFITEAAVVCTLGGMLGVIIGFATALGLKIFGVNIAFSPGPALLAFACAVATGLVFGYLPARQAARLDPVVALAAE
jgi:macrolide transport system ATP-binding/permease protein